MRKSCVRSCSALLRVPRGDHFCGSLLQQSHSSLLVRLIRSGHCKFKMRIINTHSFCRNSSSAFWYTLFTSFSSLLRNIHRLCVIYGPGTTIFYLASCTYFSQYVWEIIGFGTDRKGPLLVDALARFEWDRHCAIVLCEQLQFSDNLFLVQLF